MVRHNWSEEEKQFLRDNIKGKLRIEVQEMFYEHFGVNLSKNQLSSMIKKLGLTSGIDTRFKKGMPAHNKGKKMEIDIYSKCSGTMFKPGNKPKNTDPIGTEKILADGYVWVKIDDKPKVPKRKNWKQKHKLLWEREYGPVPKDSVVIFKDGDPTHIELSNLECVTRSQLLILNKQKLICKDKELTEAGIAVARLIDTVNKKKNVKKC